MNAKTEIAQEAENKEKAGFFAGKGLFFKLLGVLMLCELLMAAGHIYFNWVPDAMRENLYAKFFDVDREGNLPSWFSSAQFMALGFVFFLLHKIKRKKIWFVCMLGAFFCAFDEGTGLHELSGTLLKDYTQYNHDGFVYDVLMSYHSYYWVLVYIPIVLPALVAVLYFLWREIGKHMLLIISMVGLYIFGAFYLDYRDGAYGLLPPSQNYWSSNGHSFHYDLMLLEEMIEMFSVSVVLCYFMQRLACIWKKEGLDEKIAA